DRAATLAFQMEVGALQKDVVGATTRLTDVLAHLAAIKDVVRRTRTLDQSLYGDAREIERRFLDLRDELTGDETRTRRSQMAPLSITERVQNALGGTLNQTHGPTATLRREYEIARDQYAVARETLDTILDGPYQDLLDALEDAGAPWTSGRGRPGRDD
ncbi:MAG: hypothetical protein KDA28_13155, partial [Phycisphaerales bacterium]|nr:hypothetical protein [Phycisphaerales bacterium]